MAVRAQVWVFKQNAAGRCLKTNTTRGPAGLQPGSMSRNPRKQPPRGTRAASDASGIVLALSASVKRQTLSEIDAPRVSVADSSTAQAAVVTVPVVGLSLEVLERALIRFALERHGGNQTHAARFLRLSRSALLYRMRKHGLAVPWRRIGSQGAEGRLR